MLTHFFFVLQNVAPPSDLTVNVIVSVLSITLAAATNYLISSRAAGRLEGANAEQFRAIAQRLHAVEQDNKDQWSTISAHSTDIGRLQGQMDNKQTKGHHA